MSVLTISNIIIISQRILNLPVPKDINPPSGTLFPLPSYTSSFDHLAGTKKNPFSGLWALKTGWTSTHVTIIRANPKPCMPSDESQKAVTMPNHEQSNFEGAVGIY
jgi:hypothetical protein